MNARKLQSLILACVFLLSAFSGCVRVENPPVQTDSLTTPSSDAETTTPQDTETTTPQGSETTDLAVVSDPDPTSEAESQEPVPVSKDPVSYDIVENADHIRLLGRSQVINGAVTADWTASGIAFDFEGEGTMKIRMTSSSLVSLYATVDGVTKTVSQTSGTHEIKVATNLSDGVHHVELRRKSAVENKGKPQTLNLEAVIFAGKFVGKPTAQTYSISFIGDGITLGDGIPSNASDTRSYALRFAEGEKLDYEICAVSDIGLYKSAERHPYNMTQLYPHYNLFRDTETAYTPAREADLAVVNLNTVDCAENIGTEQEYKEAVRGLVADIRRLNGNTTPIVWVIGMAIEKGSTVNDWLRTVIADLGGEEAGLFLLEMDSPDTEGNNGKPSVLAHRKLAARLSALVREKSILALPAETALVDIIADTYPIADHIDSVKLLGRSMLINGAVATDWTASGIAFNYEGEGELYLSVTRSGTKMDQELTLVATVDGKDYPINVPVNIAKSEIRIAYDLPKGTHSVTIRRKTMVENSAQGILLSLDSVAFSGRFLAKPADAAYQVAFVGDSITCGVGLVSTSSGAEDGLATYAVGFIDREGVDYDICSISGIGVYRSTSKHGLTNHSMTQYYPYYNYYRSTDISYVPVRQADFVVVNLNTNDMGEGHTSGDEASYKANLKQLISEIRAAHGADTPIVWVVGMMTNQDAETNKWLNAVFDELGGKSAGLYRLLVDRDQNGGAAHPSLASHQAVSAALSNFVREEGLIAYPD